MNQFAISPDDCLILRAFREVNSLREAARFLGCDPAGLLRKVQRISDDHGFLQKVNGRWALTATGNVMVAWVEESMEAQKKAMQGHSTLRISSTTWLAEQFLIPNLGHLKKKLSNEAHFHISTPTKKFESYLLEGSCDYVIVCHPPEDPAIAHKQLFKEEWVVVAPKKWKEKNHSFKFIDLMKRPFIRHAQINPDIFGMNSAELSHLTSMTIDNLIGVRSAVKEAHGWSVVPKFLVKNLLKEQSIVEIDYDIEMDRKVCLWWLRNNTESKKKSHHLSSWLIECQAKT